MEDFIPAVPQAEVEKTPDMLAAGKLAEVAGDERFISIVQKSAKLSVFQQFKVIENQAQYDQSIDAFDAAKGAIKELEGLRHTVVDYPTKFVKLVNNLFKQIRDGLEMSKGHLGKIIDAKKTADEAAVVAAPVEMKEKGEVVVNEDGVVQMGEGIVPQVSNTVESARGAKVHTRKVTEVEVVDLVAFLKVLVSKNARYKWLVEAREDLVEVKLSTLKQLIKENGNKKVPGIVVKQTTKTI